MRGLIPLILLLESLASGAPTVASQPATAPSPTELNEAIDRLGDPDAQVRKDAEHVLWFAGRSAEALLKAAAQGTDPEIAARARNILKNFEMGISPDTPTKVVELLKQYRDADQNRRRQIVLQIRGADPQDRRIVAKLWLAEKNDAARELIFGRNIPSQLVAWGQQLIMDGDAAAAADFMRAAARSADDTSARNAAAYFLVTGSLDAAIADAEKRLAAGDVKGSATFLIYAYRARGDLNAAGRMAQDHASALVQAELARERGDWRAAIAALEKCAESPNSPLPRSGRLAACYRLAGDEARCRQIIDRIDTPALDVMSLVKLYFLNDRPADGLKRLANVPAGQPTGNADPIRVEILCRQWRFREAMDLAKQDKSGNSLIPLAIGLHRFGASAHAWEIIEPLHRRATDDKNANLFTRLLYAYKELGAPAKTRELFLQYLALFGEKEPVLPIYYVLPEKDINGSHWWRLERKLNPGETQDAALGRLEQFFAGKMSRDEARTLLDFAEKELAGLREAERPPAVTEITRIATLYALDAGQIEHYALLAPMQGWTLLGDMFAKKGEWKGAAAAYERAYELERSNRFTQPLTLILQGRALEKSGQPDEGRALVERAHQMLLGGDYVRSSLIYGLVHHDLQADAQRQRELAERVGQFDDYNAGELLQSRADNVAKTDPLMSADLFERYLLRLYQPNSFFFTNEPYLTLPHVMHRWRASGFAMKGDFTSALRHWQMCLEYFPLESDDASEAFALLNKLDRAPQADALYSRTRDGLGALCDDYPDCPAAHNNLAWLAGRCRRDLEMALKHANKAVELSPANAAYVDTLAEVQFAQGNKTAAIASMRKAVEIAPKSAMLRERLKKMENAE